MTAWQWVFVVAGLAIGAFVLWLLVAFLVGLKVGPMLRRLGEEQTRPPRDKPQDWPSAGHGPGDES